MSKFLETISAVDLWVDAGSYLRLGELNKKNNELINITKQIGEAQSKLQNIELQIQSEQLEVQNKMLIQLEIQNKIKLKEALEREKQKELKDVFFMVKSKIEEIILHKDNLTVFIDLCRIEKDLIQNDLKPNDLEEIKDKEFASDVLKIFYQEKEKATNNLTDEEKKDLETICNIRPKIKFMKQQYPGLQKAQNKIHKIQKEKPVSNFTIEIVRMVKYLSLIAMIAVLFFQETFSGLLFFFCVIVFAWSFFFVRKKDIGRKIKQELKRIDIRTIEEMENKVSEISIELSKANEILADIYSRHPNTQFNKD